MGLALDIYLELHVFYPSDSSMTKIPNNFLLSYDGWSPSLSRLRDRLIDNFSGDGAAHVSLKPEVNLITRVATYVLRCHDAFEVPSVYVRVINAIPLGRGLGSSVSCTSPESTSTSEV